MSKVHIIANKAVNRAPFSLCASRVSGEGKVSFNGRATYRFMASQIVKIEEAKAMDDSKICAHCIDIYLERRNAKRRANGWAPVTNWRAPAGE